MTLRTRREILVTPGPTTIPDEVLSAMHRPAIDLYSRELEEVTLGCLSDLRSIFATHGDLYIYAANGHGAWEAALANVLSRGDTVLVLESHFAKGWSEMAKMLGLKVELLAQDFRSALDPDLLREALAKDRSIGSKLFSSCRSIPRRACATISKRFVAQLTRHAIRRS